MPNKTTVNQLNTRIWTYGLGLLIFLCLSISLPCRAEDKFGFKELAEITNKINSLMNNHYSSEEIRSIGEIVTQCATAATDSYNLGRLYYILINMESVNDKKFVSDVLTAEAKDTLKTNETRINAIQELKVYMTKRIISPANKSIAVIKTVNKKIYDFIK